MRPSPAMKEAEAMDPARGEARRTHPRRWRGVRSVAKWGGLFISVLIAGVWGVSLWWSLNITWGKHARFDAPGNWMVVVNGCLLYCDLGPVFGNTPQAWHWWANPAPKAPMIWRPHGSWRASTHDLYLPLWLPFIVCALPTASLLHHDRPSARRRRAGQCVKCGYFLGGLAPGAVCPECGRASATTTAAVK